MMRAPASTCSLHCLLHARTVYKQTQHTVSTIRNGPAASARVAGRLAAERGHVPVTLQLLRARGVSLHHLSGAAAAAGAGHGNVLQWIVQTSGTEGDAAAWSGTGIWRQAAAAGGSC